MCYCYATVFIINIDDVDLNVFFVTALFVISIGAYLFCFQH